MQSDFLAALDIGGTKMAVTVANRERILSRVTAPTPKSGTPRALPEQGIAMIGQACAEAGIAAEEIQTVGVASCGPFVHSEGMLCLSAPNICGGRSGASDLPNDWTLIPIEKVLCERFATVAIENDCVAALAGERMFGAVQGEANCAYVTWSTGVGFGLCVDGRLLRGKQGNAGHAGHMLMAEREDAVCGCGNRGDLEGLISGRNIANRLQVPAAELFDAAQAGETRAQAAVLEAASFFGRGLYNLAAILDMKTFVIGGSVWQHHGDWLKPHVEAEIVSRMPALTEGVTIVNAGLGSHVADVGAFSLVLPEDWASSWRLRKPWETIPD
ncbi:ROK family protein [Noviherbaspirillum sp. CPCC 100848]|uniref:ROK family protein n=1 Tax=Noviherbaspirillum album TaxID=3080276 RepID=A0ABU6J6Q3_9BURK|nr:ROK family protein [Noviherbaspirillum sp. CPCC 100848]MEC4719326.1 ROK family protein [Noviherbaspirillum sp. CPCC 100848]